MWYALLLQVSGMRGHIGEQSKSGSKKCCSSHVPVEGADFKIITSILEDCIQTYA